MRRRDRVPYRLFLPNSAERFGPVAARPGASSSWIRAAALAAFLGPVASVERG